MQYTEHYQFKKPEPTEFVNIKDLNDTADMVDAKLFETLEEANDIKEETIKEANTILEANRNKADKSTATTAIITASLWTGEAAPFIATVPVTGITVQNYSEVSLADNWNDEQYEACTAADIRKITHGAGKLTLTAYGTKPEVDITISVIIRGDL